MTPSPYIPETLQNYWGYCGALSNKRQPVYAIVAEINGYYHGWSINQRQIMRELDRLDESIHGPLHVVRITP